MRSETWAGIFRQDIKTTERGGQLRPPFSIFREEGNHDY